MKIECIKEQLEEALNKASKISAKSNTLPALSGLYLNAKQNTLSLKATNLDLGISINIPVKVTEPGTTVVPAQVITAFISSLSSDKNIIISTKGQTLEVKTKNTKTTIKTLQSEDFPVIPKLEDDKSFSIQARDLVFGIRSVVYAASIGGPRPELSAVAMIHEGDAIIFAATDSFRLAEKKIRVKKSPRFKQILIPQKNALEISRIFDRGEEDVFISVEEHQVAMRSANTYLTSRVVDGVFPDYKQIIPKEVKSKAIVLKQDLVNAMKTSLIFSDSFNQLTFNLSPKGKSFSLESKNQSVGENIDSIDAALEGDDILININHRYFTDCFQSITTDSVSLEFGGQAKPVVVRGVGDTSFLYLVMPMNQT